MTALMDLITAHGVIFWLGCAGILLGIELMTGTAWFLWAAAAAVLTAGLTLFPMFIDPRMQVLVFVAVAVLATFAGRPYVKKWLRRHGDTDINDRQVEGHTGHAVADFEGDAGRVFINGAEWAARLDGDGPVAKGDSVVVLGRIEGATLVVRRA